MVYRRPHGHSTRLGELRPERFVAFSTLQGIRLHEFLPTSISGDTDSWEQLEINGHVGSRFLLAFVFLLLRRLC